ncbi:MAG: alginate lyase family protein [Gammaproteobacteria bacterium]
MSASEIVHRLARMVRCRVEKAGFALADRPPPKGSTGSCWVDAIPKAFTPAIYLDAADRILQGRFALFALEAADLGFPPDWNKDPLTGVKAPLTFGKTINYRDQKVVGNIKYLWEVNRHLELVTLAQAWHLSGQRRYAEGCKTLLESWFAQCPYMLGVNWNSGLEVAIRLVNWSFAWHLLGGDRSPLFAGDAGAGFRSRWLEMVFRHLHFVAGHRSYYSSANNHLLGELLGLLVGSLTWPLWRETERWSARAHAEFEREALLQNTGDGVNREQAVWYHHEVADMMLIAGLIARANSTDFSPAFWTRLEAMLDFIFSVMDTRGGVPAWGDSDDAVIVRFSPDRHLPVYRSLLATGATLFDRADFKRKAVSFDDKSRWLLGDAPAGRFEGARAEKVRREPRQSFPAGGYYVLGADLETDAEILVVADAGPLGYLSIAAHGHADALAFTLSVGGEAILVDPGTYSYDTSTPWRNYFRGTSGHNTLRVDGLDQSVAGGSFLWTRHAHAVCENFEISSRADRLVASHDGYMRLSDPVSHRREIVLDKVQRTLEVKDDVRCRSAHLVEIFWHFSEGCDVRLDDGFALVASAGREIRVDWPQDATVDLVRGRESPPLGWVSHRMHEKHPSYTLVVTKKIDGDWSASTRISVSRGE